MPPLHTHLFSHLCCHDETRCSGVDGDVPRHQPHILELFEHLSILLVGEGFDGAGEDNSLLLSESQSYGIPRRKTKPLPLLRKRVLIYKNTENVALCKIFVM